MNYEIKGSNPAPRAIETEHIQRAREVAGMFIDQFSPNEQNEMIYEVIRIVKERRGEQIKSMAESLKMHESMYEPLHQLPNGF